MFAWHTKYHVEISVLVIPITYPQLSHLVEIVNSLMIDTAITQSAIPANLARDKLVLQSESCSSGLLELLNHRYAIQSLLGRGGFGVTFLARNMYLPEHPVCVVKKFAPIFNDPKLLAIARHQFGLESLMLSRLGSHAQVPTLLDCFQINDDAYLVEEYIPGTVLSQLVSRDHQFTEVEVESFLTQMLRLLEYIHSHNLVHRDIKPQNIILCQTDHRYVLVDFGAVKDLSPVIDAGKQAEYSTAVGTPGFAPPEQLANYPVYASDIYALGMTCIYLLTGKEPREFNTDPYTCELMWAEDLELSAGLLEIINKMTQMPLVDRYQSATQVLMALDNRSIRAKLRTYLDQKHAVARGEHSGSLIYYPAVVHRALGIG
jgi:serine/threonine protein kinase